MPKCGNAHQCLSRLAAVVAAIFCILAIISAAADSAIWIAAISWLTAAGVALLFAIFFVADNILEARVKKHPPAA